MTTSTTSTRTSRTRRSSTNEHGSSGAADKDHRLRELLSGFSSAIVAFSGGVDSAYLSVVATQVLGPGALCVTADSPSYPEHHRSLARQVAQTFALRHEVVATAELERPEYRANPVNRCYYCKDELYSTLTALASARAIDVVLDGNNADDRGDYRPGRTAAREHGVRSPLDEVGLTKAEIRELSRAAGMVTWDEPASACLSSRVPYDHEITNDTLRMIERAEDALRALGFRVCRVRHHDTLARLEFGRDEIARALDEGMRDEILKTLRDIGYRQVAVDLQGYRMGSLNVGIRLQPV
jgi:uncharacterized protein